VSERDCPAPSARASRHGNHARLSVGSPFVLLKWVNAMFLPDRVPATAKVCELATAGSSSRLISLSLRSSGSKSRFSGHAWRAGG
jgi:hypothetical protein